MDTLKQAIRARLIAAGITDPIFDTRAPIGQLYPLLVFQYVAGGYDNTDSLDTRNELWQVKAVTTEHEQAETLADSIRAALHQQPLTITGWRHLWTVQEDHVWMVEAAARRTLYHAGGLFRILLHRYTP